MKETGQHSDILCPSESITSCPFDLANDFLTNSLYVYMLALKCCIRKLLWLMMMLVLLAWIIIVPFE